ncbi:MAG: MazG-like family protein [Candidatus Parvarchaeum sp.]
MEKTIKELKEVAKNFIDDRDWRKFQTSKDLAEDISVEANELLELFLWKGGKELDKKAKKDKEFLQKIKNETADVLFGCLAMSDHLDFDLEEAFLSKIKQLEKRYDVKEVKGKSVKIDEEEWLRKNKGN